MEHIRIARGALRRLPIAILKLFGLVLGSVLLAAITSDVLRLGPQHAYIAAVAALAAVVAFLVYLNLPGSMYIGTDGLFIDWRDERRYVAFSELDAVEAYVESTGGKSIAGVSLALVEERVKVPIGEHSEKRAGELCERIRTALEQYRSRDCPEDTQFVEPRGRQPEDWLDRLRGVGAGATARLREQAVPSERLWRIVESPAAGNVARAGAAAALSQGLDDDGKRRLRTAARETAAPRLRIALESAAAEDEATLLEALTEIERAGHETNDE